MRRSSQSAAPASLQVRSGSYRFPAGNEPLPSCRPLSMNRPFPSKSLFLPPSIKSGAFPATTCWTFLASGSFPLGGARNRESRIENREARNKKQGVAGDLGTSAFPPAAQSRICKLRIPLDKNRPHFEDHCDPDPAHGARRTSRAQSPRLVLGRAFRFLDGTASRCPRQTVPFHGKSGWKLSPHLFSGHTCGHSLPFIKALSCCGSRAGFLPLCSTLPPDA